MVTIAVPDDDVLQHMAEEHVHYELHRVAEFRVFGNGGVRQLLAFDAGEPKPVRDDIADWYQAALLESGLVHLRNVSDFLTKPRPTSKNHETDLVADQYFRDGWGNRPGFVFGANKDEHDTLLAEIHRRVVHLSTQRATVQDAGSFLWHDYVMTQFPVLVRAFGAFLIDLYTTEPDRAPWFDRCNNVVQWALKLSGEA